MSWTEEKKQQEKKVTEREKKKVYKKNENCSKFNLKRQIVNCL